MKLTESDYKFIVSESDPTDENYYVKLAGGDWDGLIYRYGQIKFIENINEDECTLSFKYDIIDANGYEDVESIPGFNNYVGAVLHNILESAIDNDEYRIGDAPDNSTKKPNKQ